MAAPYQPYAPGRPRFELGGFWPRLGAFLLDGIILFVPAIVGFLVLAEVIPRQERELCTIDGELATCENPTGAGWAILIVAGIAYVVGVLLYYALLEGRRGATVGRRAVGLSVVDRETLAPIGAGRAVGRYFGRVVSQIPCYLGYFWMLWDEDKQTWHDKMVSSIVVKSATLPVAGAAPTWAAQPSWGGPPPAGGPSWGAPPPPSGSWNPPGQPAVPSWGAPPPPPPSAPPPPPPPTGSGWPPPPGS